MRLSQIFEAGGVLVRPPWETFDDAVRGMVANLVSNQQIDPALGAPAVQAICEREAAESTAIVEIGVSIPHARLAGVDGLAATFATSPTGVYFETAGLPIMIMVLVLSAPELAAEHLRFLSKISMLLQSQSIRDNLCNAQDSAAALAMLRRQEGI